MDNPKLNLGCGRRPREGFVNVDWRKGPGVDVAWDLRKHPWPWESGRVDEIYASHFVEHLQDVEGFTHEAHRVLRPGGRLVIVVPYGIRYLQNPLHHHAFNEHSMMYFCQDDTSLQSMHLFDLERWRITKYAYPFRWHLKKYLRIELPFGRRNEITFWLRKPGDS